jgi:hypothetical protein
MTMPFRATKHVSHLWSLFLYPIIVPHFLSTPDRQPVIRSELQPQGGHYRLNQRTCQKRFISTMDLSFGVQELLLLYAYEKMFVEMGNEVIKNFEGHCNFILKNYSPIYASQINMKIMTNL